MGSLIGKSAEISSSVYLCSYASTVGPKEGDGPLKYSFDEIIEDEMYDEKTWEKAESKMVRNTYTKILSKGCVLPGDVNYILTGDLLNQCIASSFGLKESQTPFMGLYGACSTMAESIAAGAMLVDGGFANNVVAITSSHYCSSERQYRFPIEFGHQRTNTAQWTVTGAGGVLISNKSDNNNVMVKRITIGKIVDMGIKDVNNMGAAMAPAAAETLLTHFKDFNIEPSYYDLIVTGDLGMYGKEICIDLVRMNGYDISKNYEDCGLMIFDEKAQDVHAGGSGCGCSASVFAGELMGRLKQAKINRLLFVGTGSLLSPVSSGQGQPVLGIAHAVGIER